MMSKWVSFLMAIVIFGITQHADGLSSMKGCLTGKQAESLNEEILKLFEEAPLVESLTTLTSNISIDAFSHIEPCFDVKAFIDMIKAILKTLGQDSSEVVKLYEQSRLNNIHKFIDGYRQIITPLIGYAQQVEQRIKEGNQRRQVLLDTTTSFKDIWQNIRLIQKEHQKTLQALDIFLRDSILQKSAEIGQYVREGNSKGRWTVRKVRDVLLKEMDRVTKMMGIFSAASPLNTMIYEMVQNYAVSQVYSALQKSKLENAMLSDSMIRWRFERFSEVTISESLRKASKLMYESLEVGMETAQKYHNEVNQTVASVRKGMKAIESTSIISDCKFTLSMIRVSATLLLTSGIIQITQGPLLTADSYRKEIEAFSTVNILPTVNEISIKQALKPVVQSVPKDEATRNKLGEAVQYLTNFIEDVQGLEIVETNKTLAQVSVYVKQLLEVFQCHRKSMQLIGRIIQGCKDGRDDFEGLYNKHSSSLNADLTKCSETWQIDIPSKSTIQQQVSYASTPEMFNFKFPNCRQNQQQDDPGYVYYEGDDYDDDDTAKKLSPSQRMMVCDLRKRSKTQSKIAQLIKMEERMIGAVRCARS